MGGPRVPLGSQASEFIQQFERQYGQSRPHWQEKSWSDASRIAQRQFKLLYVYLHSPHHQVNFLMHTLQGFAVVSKTIRHCVGIDIIEYQKIFCLDREFLTSLEEIQPLANPSAALPAVSYRPMEGSWPKFW